MKSPDMGFIPAEMNPKTMDDMVRFEYGDIKRCVVVVRFSTVINKNIITACFETIEKPNYSKLEKLARRFFQDYEKSEK